MILKPITKRKFELRNITRTKVNGRTHYKGYIRKPFKSIILNSILKVSVKSNNRQGLEMIRLHKKPAVAK